MAGLGKAALKSAIGAALAMGVLGAGQAQALVVTVNSQQWDVTTFTGSYNANTALIQSQVWWKNGVLTDQFATAVFNNLGTPNSIPSGPTAGPAGPFFAITDANGASVINVRVYSATSNSVINRALSPSSTSNVWAQAYLVNVPGPLPAFGAAVAFGFSRKLRKRIKDIKSVGASFSAA
jgi:hypothetical protein